MYSFLAVELEFHGVDIGLYFRVVEKLDHAQQVWLWYDVIFLSHGSCEEDDIRIAVLYELKAPQSNVIIPSQHCKLVVLRLKSSDQAEITILEKAY